MTTSTLTIIIKDRNEAKTLLAWGFITKLSPRDCSTLDFVFEASDELFEARRAYSLNRPVPCLSFVEASKQIDGLIYSHRIGRLK